MRSRPLLLARWIETVSWAFVLLGVFLPVLFYTAPFAIYRETIARWAYGASPVPASDERLLGLMLGITGGSIAGKWIVHALVARGPLAEGRAWARDLTLRGLGAWFLVDSIASLALGATFNVWMINLAPLALVGVPLVLSRRAFEYPADPLPRESSKLARICLWTAVFGASTGLVIAFGGTTPAFGLWFGALENAHYAGAPLAEGARRLALFFFGPIGGCTFAQFVMLAGFVRHEGGSRRVGLAGALSIAAWCTIDSGYGLANDGLFNILMINVPALAATLPPWILLRRSLGRWPGGSPSRSLKGSPGRV